MLQSLRVDSGDPALEAFTDLTYSWLDELRADFQRQRGRPFGGGAGVLFANDVLVALHGRDAAWSRFDVAAFEQWIAQNASGFARVLPSMLTELACFTSYLARTERIAPEIALATQARLHALVGLAAPPVAPTIVETVHPWAPRNRAERRAARRDRRRMS